MGDYEKTRSVVGLMVVGPGEADRYLEASLNEFKRLTDTAVIVGNNTDEKTEKLIKKYGFWFYRDDREWGIHQPAIKTDLLKKIGRLKPDVVLPLDADETFSATFTRKELEEYSFQYPACYFYIVNLWNDVNHHRKSLGFWNIRMFNFKSEFGLDYLKKNVHCGLAPPWTYIYGSYVPFMVKHFGLMKSEDRAKKVARYERYDPNAQFKDRSYYEALKYDGAGAEFNEAEFQDRLAAEVTNYGNQTKKISMSEFQQKYVMVKRLVDLREIDMKKEEWEAMGADRKKGFQFLYVIGDADNKIEVPQPTKLDALACPICGFQAKTQAGLNTHKKRHQ